MGEGEDLRSRLGKWTLSAYRRLQSGSDSSESICIHIHTHVYIYIYNDAWQGREDGAYS